MIVLDDCEVALGLDRVAIPLAIAAPVRRGHIDAWLSASRAGPPARGALVRQLAVRDSVIPPFTVFGRDLVEVWPKGGRAWVVVSYAGTVVATGVVRLSR